MKRSKFSEEQVAYALRQVETGTPVGDVCRQLGVSEATFYTWKKKYAHLGVSELRRLRQLEDEKLGVGEPPPEIATSEPADPPADASRAEDPRVPQRGRATSGRSVRR